MPDGTVPGEMVVPRFLGMGRSTSHGSPFLRREPGGYSSKSEPTRSVAPKEASSLGDPESHPGTKPRESW